MGKELKRWGELEEGKLEGPGPQHKRPWNIALRIVSCVDENVHNDSHPYGSMKESQCGNNLTSCLEAAAAAALFQSVRHLWTCLGSIPGRI